MVGDPGVPPAASTVVAAHGRGSIVVVVESAATVDGGPVGTVSGTTVAPEEHEAASSARVAKKEEMRRTGMRRLTDRETYSGGMTIAGPIPGGGGMYGGSSQMCTGMPTKRCGSNQSASARVTRTQPWDAG